jgi:hypothetical protein
MLEVIKNNQMIWKIKKTNSREINWRITELHLHHNDKK